jgi:nucleoside-diphosphate-sugar epimerase
MYPFVSIIGTGWLGLPLARLLVQADCRVFGTTTRDEKIELLTAEGILCNKMIFNDDVSKTDIQIPHQTEILVITLPPTLGKQAPLQSYIDIIERIIHQTNHLVHLKKLLFTSSTSVYGRAKGVLTEETAIQPHTPSEETLAQAERIINEKTGDYAVYVLRLGGLVGPGREPGNFFKDKKDIPGGEISVNLVHQVDVLNIMKHIILKDTPEGTFNICPDEHPARGDFYPQRARKVGVKEATFISGNEPERYVSNEKVKKKTGYTFVYPDPLFFPSGN